MSTQQDDMRFRFGPRDRRGLIGGVRTGQLLVVGACLVGAVLVLRDVGGPMRAPFCLLLVGGGVVFSWWPIGGRTAEEWFPLFARFISRTVLGGRSSLVDVAQPDRRRAPLLLSALQVVELEHGDGRIGAVSDSTSGYLSAVLLLAGGPFALSSPDDRLERVAAWASVLAAIANGAGAISRLQWIERTLPDLRDAYRRRISSASSESHTKTAPLNEAARHSYSSLLSSEAVGALRHELLLSVSVRAARGLEGRLARSDPSASAVLSEIERVAERCREAGFVVERLLDPDGLRSVIGRTFDRLGADSPTSWPWPLAVEANWSTVCTDGTWHATYWIAEWPRSDVGPDFLLPLLVSAHERRTVSLVMAPVPPHKALRAAERARTSGRADEDLRQRHGFQTTARTRRESEAVNRREWELAGGHGAFQFSGYITVTGNDRGELERSCARLEQLAALAHLELRRLYGAQLEGLIRTLPTGRGCA